MPIDNTGAAPIGGRGPWFEPLDLRSVLDRKGSHRVAVCLPARNEEATVGPIVAAIRRDLMGEVGLVDDLVVIDDGSTDATAEVARQAGARVVPTVGECRGKGLALWTSVAATTADLIVWCDADLEGFTSDYVVGLVTPLVSDESVAFVKGAYERPVDDGDVGGRVTELVARPLLHVLHPSLAHLDQPLGGEYAGRRSVLQRLPFEVGYGVDLGLLLDVARLEGPESIAQVDLGIRRHRRRRLLELEPQALEVLLVALRRAGIGVPDDVALIRRGRTVGAVRTNTLPPLEDSNP